MVTDRDDPNVQIIAKLVAIQLLASSFTPPQRMNTLYLPAGWYHKEHMVDDRGNGVGLVSSLRQHTQFKYAPAHGHHARDNSLVSLRSDVERPVSREERLAEHVSCSRSSKQRERRGIKRGLIHRRRHHRAAGKRRRIFLSLRRRHNLDGQQRTSPRQQFKVIPLDSTHRPQESDQCIGHGRRGGQPRTANRSHRSTVDPAVRLEAHPLFIQPVKQYVLGKWRDFRSRTRSDPDSGSSDSARGDPERGRRASKDSIQLNRRTQLMTLFQSSAISSAMLPVDPGTETLLSIVAGASPSPADLLQDGQQADEGYMSRCKLDTFSNRQSESHEDRSIPYASLPAQGESLFGSSGAWDFGQVRNGASACESTVVNLSDVSQWPHREYEKQQSETDRHVSSASLESSEVTSLVD